MNISKSYCYTELTAWSEIAYKQAQPGYQNAFFLCYSYATPRDHVGTAHLIHRKRRRKTATNRILVNFVPVYDLGAPVTVRGCWGPLDCSVQLELKLLNRIVCDAVCPSRFSECGRWCI